MTMTTTKKMLAGTVVVVMMIWTKPQTQLVLRQMTQNFLNSFDGTLEDADASASPVYASASRSLQEARELLARVKSARGYFLVVGIGAFDGLAQPSTDRKHAKSRGKGKKGKRKGTSSTQKGGNRQVWCTWHLCQNHRSHVLSLVLRSKKRPTEAGATRGGPHHAPRLRLDQCMLCRQV